MDCTEPFDFFTWVDTLSDEEHTAVLEALRAAACDLDVVIEEKPQIVHQLLDLAPHSHAAPFLN
jgi:hypothetical protein